MHMWETWTQSFTVLVCFEMHGMGAEKASILEKGGKGSKCYI